VFNLPEVLRIQENEVVHADGAVLASPLVSAQLVPDVALIAGATTISCWRSMVHALDASKCVITQVTQFLAS
jgi:hypothetical protein